MKSEYWENYYIANKKDYSPPSPFAIWLRTYISERNIKTMVDVGCGNGRDTYYFGTWKYTVTGVDNAVLPENNNLTTFKKKSMGDLEGQFDILYSRFSLHSVDEEVEDKVLNYAANNCKYIAIECRSSNDKLSTGKSENSVSTSYATEHYRRYINLENLKQKMINLKFKILHVSESSSYAPYKDTNPMCLRIVAEAF